MEHPLQNPVWNALISGNKALALGSGKIRFFDDEVSPFAALEENTTENLLALHKQHLTKGVVLLWSEKQLNLPKEWKLIDCIPGLQMVYEKTTVPAYLTDNITKLAEKDIPDMLELTNLTKPGPFGRRTIEFGNYEGIFVNDQLVAMTGQRFHCYHHIEISAVCTHPLHQGKGYAKQLLLSQLEQIIAAGSNPYLHVKTDNQRAVNVYEALGFTVRMPVYFYVIKACI